MSRAISHLKCMRFTATMRDYQTVNQTTRFSSTKLHYGMFSSDEMVSLAQIPVTSEKLYQFGKQIPVENGCLDQRLVLFLFFLFFMFIVYFWKCISLFILLNPFRSSHNTNVRFLSAWKHSHALCSCPFLGSSFKKWNLLDVWKRSC